MEKVKVAKPKEEKWVDGKALKDFGLAVKNKIDGKISKNGDTMTGNLAISKDGDTRITFKDTSTKTTKLELVRTANDDIYLENYTTRKYLKLKADGSTELMADNLNTTSKEVIGAINEMNDTKIAKTTKITVTDFDLLTSEGHFNAMVDANTPNSPEVDPYSCDIIILGTNDIILQIVILTLDKVHLRRKLRTSWGKWEKLVTTASKEFLGNTGVSSIQYIQDDITKEKGKGYFDKTTGEMYICLVTTDEKNVTKGKFELASNIENRYRISKIEERLGIYSPISKINSISVSRDEGSTSPSLEYSEK